MSTSSGPFSEEQGQFYQLSLEDVYDDKECQMNFKRYLLAMHLPQDKLNFLLDMHGKDINDNGVLNEVFPKYHSIFDQNLLNDRKGCIEKALKDCTEALSEEVSRFFQRDITLNTMKNIILHFEAENGKKNSLTIELESEMAFKDAPPKKPQTVEEMLQKFEAYLGHSSPNLDRNYDKKKKCLESLRQVQSGDKLVVLLELEKSVMPKLEKKEMLGHFMIFRNAKEKEGESPKLETSKKEEISSRPKTS